MAGKGKPDLSRLQPQGQDYGFPIDNSMSGPLPPAPPQRGLKLVSQDEYGSTYVDPSGRVFTFDNRDPRNRRDIDVDQFFPGRGVFEEGRAEGRRYPTPIDPYYQKRVREGAGQAYKDDRGFGHSTRSGYYAPDGPYVKTMLSPDGKEYISAEGQGDAVPTPEQLRRWMAQHSGKGYGPAY